MKIFFVFFTIFILSTSCSLFSTKDNSSSSSNVSNSETPETTPTPEISFTPEITPTTLPSLPQWYLEFDNFYGYSALADHDLENPGFYIGGIYWTGYGPHGLFFKITDNGDIPWNKVYRGENFNDYGNAFYSVSNAHDNGFILAGCSDNYGANRDDNKDVDAWIIKTDIQGNIEWSKNYGRKNIGDRFYKTAVIDEGYLFIGTTGEARVETPEYPDIWIIKSDFSGEVIWQKSYGLPGSNNQETKPSIVEVNDGYIISTPRNPIAGGGIAWYFKIDKSEGRIIWQKCLSYYGDGYSINSMKLTDKGQNIIAIGTDRFRYIAFKIKSTDGSLVWAESSIFQYSPDRYTSFFAEAYDVAVTEDDDYLIVGSISINYHDTPWILKIDNNGTPIWQKTYTNHNSTVPKIIQELDGRGFIIGGTTVNGSKAFMFSISPDGDCLDHDTDTTVSKVSQAIYFEESTVEPFDTSEETAISTVDIEDISIVSKSP